MAGVGGAGMLEVLPQLFFCCSGCGRGVVADKASLALLLLLPPLLLSALRDPTAFALDKDDDDCIDVDAGRGGGGMSS